MISYPLTPLALVDILGIHPIFQAQNMFAIAQQSKYLPSLKISLLAKQNYRLSQT
jgi:hypothetical protein